MNYKIIILFVTIISFSGKSYSTESPKHIEKRSYNWSYPVIKNALFEINNKYGDITVNTWAQNTIEIKATVTFSHSNEKIAKEKINCIRVETSGNTKYVSAKTLFDCTLSTKNNNQKNSGVKIDYEIKIPAYGNLVVQNKYGNITLGTIGGNTNIQLKYGNLTADTLKSNSNILNLDYSPNTHINLINQLSIQEATYSTLTINALKSISFNSKYTNLNLNKVEQIWGSQIKYGNLQVNETNCITLQSAYSNINIDLLHNCLNLDIDYGAYKIGQTNDIFKSIDITANYTDGKLKINKNANFKIYAKARYASLNLSSGIDINYKNKKATSIEVQAEHLNSQNNIGNIKINSNYGNIKIETSK